LAKYSDCYVPDFLSIGSPGFGDYIRLKIGKNGIIEGWRKPFIDENLWQPVERSSPTLKPDQIAVNKDDLTLIVAAFGPGVGNDAQQAAWERLCAALEAKHD